MDIKTLSVDPATGEIIDEKPEIDWSALDTNDIVDTLGRVQEQMKVLKNDEGRLQHELLWRLEELNATKRVAEDFEANVTVVGISYDPDALLPIIDLDGIDYDDLVASGAYTPPHDAPVEHSWNQTHLKTFNALNGEVDRIREQARSGGRRSVTVKARKSKKLNPDLQLADHHDSSEPTKSEPPATN